MEKKNSYGMQIINKAGSQLKGKWGKAFLATIIYLFPLIALCAIPYAGWAVSICLFAYLTLGYIKYLQLLMAGKNPKLNVIFTQTQNFFSNLLIAVILILGVVLGLALAIVPGLFMIAYFSMIFHVCLSDDCKLFTDALSNTAIKMKGKKTEMFSYKVFFYAIFVVLLVSAGLIGFYCFTSFETSKLATVLIGVGSGIILFILLSIAMMYFVASNVVFYDEVVHNYTVEIETQKEFSEFKKSQNKQVSNVTVLKTENVKPADASVKTVKNPAKSSAKPAVKKPAVKAAATTKAATKPAALNSAKKPAGTQTSTRTKKTVVKKSDKK